MNLLLNNDSTYKRPVEIADDIYWVGFFDEETGQNCNPYLIIDNDEAVVIDGGTRPNFPEIMVKILQTGIEPFKIKALICQSYYPDTCGNITNFEDIIGVENLKIISDKDSYQFIKYYGNSCNFVSTEEINYEYTFSSGRKIMFFNVPYSRSQGNFISFDTKTGVLFTSYLFGSYENKWNLFLNFTEDCTVCLRPDICPKRSTKCPINGIVEFHKKNMSSKKSLKFSLEVIKNIPAKKVAPQHGSIISAKEDIDLIIKCLSAIKKVGIDYVISVCQESGKYCINSTKERLVKNGY
jgi:flavorubredoxin